MKSSDVLLHSRRLRPTQSGTQIALTPKRAKWHRVGFAVRQFAAGAAWRSRTGGDEVCLVLLSGLASVTWSPDRPHPVQLGPRRNVFADYPHAVYLPPGTAFEIRAPQAAEIAECRSPTTRRFPAREIRPEDCGLEVRGGGNATRQIIDILPPAAAADRLLVCEVLTPAGNWSSYPPHKHDVDNPPVEADLEEIYYYRMQQPDGYGLQRLYTADGSRDETVRVDDGDLVLVRDGYHPYVSAYGIDSYYLNVLAGTRRSMAASDDPRYAAVRQSWPAPDPRVPVIPRP